MYAELKRPPWGFSSLVAFSGYCVDCIPKKVIMEKLADTLQHTLSLLTTTATDYFDKITWNQFREIVSGYEFEILIRGETILIFLWIDNFMGD